MTRRIRLTRRAQVDVEENFHWIRRRSPKGARRWYEALLRLLKRIGDDPLAFGLAHEQRLMSREVRQALFKTRSGNCYRVLFLVAEEIQVVRVRGKGQRLVSDRDLTFDEDGDLIDPIDDLR